MGQIESLIFLLGAAAQLARVLRVPYPVFLVLGGLLIGFVPGLPTVEISPEVMRRIQRDLDLEASWIGG